MFVYANLIGAWTELTEDYLIDNLDPETFVKEKLLNPNYNINFVTVQFNNDCYVVDKSCVQVTYKTNSI